MDQMEEDDKKSLEISEKELMEEEAEKSDQSNELSDNPDNDEAEDSDNDDDDDDKADELEVKKLEAILAQNPFDYNTHVLLISKLQSMGELERLRKARENMSSKYPLTSELWLSWLRDEMKLAVTSEEKSALVNLFERAIKDYLSVEVWLEYLQFNIGSVASSGTSMNSVRDLFERALTSAGLHVTKGAIIWEAYREFENVLIGMTADEAEKVEQINRVGNLFRRQLACPLLDMEKTYEEYKIWKSDLGKDSNIDDNIVSLGYNRAHTDLNSRLPYEEKIISYQSESELFDYYKAYLNYEKQHGDPARVSILFERAVADLSLHNKLWEDYLNYLDSTIKMESVLTLVYERATRNVPWCAEIWKKWMRSMEKWEKSLLEIQSILENALEAGFTTADDYRNIWLVFLEYLRRRVVLATKETEEMHLETIRHSFNRACEHLAKLFGLDGDPQCVILQFWARTEAIHGNSMEKARSLWADILSQGHSASASSWLEYVSLERCYGDTKHLRKLFQKALTAVKDWPESVANAWIDFERDEGTLEQMEFCEIKTKEKLQKVMEERQKTQAKIQEPDTQQVYQKRPEKRKLEKEGRWKNLDVTMSKISRIEKSTSKESSSNAVNDKEKEKKITPPPGYKPSDEKTVTDDEVDEKITIFVSNLDYTATEEEIRTAIQSVGPITKFKMVKDYKGRSKGFCYIQLSSANAVELALKLDRTPINGRPMFISRCDPNKTTRSSAFKYACDLEKNKLFVKGLPVTTTKEDLENIFKVHGNLKDVRLVTYRNGHSKGLAYVEFEDEANASKALLATDGMTIGDKVISVAISKPPERKKLPEETQIKSLGGTSVSRTHLGGPKTMLSMVPRSVKTNIKNGTTNDSSESVKPMKNEDFRNMLLNKK
ncbi:squamous cell carcinoma antigen recognized by T-cells 3 [Chelonus insularis]|uniref:squamous cell carcinoma antigen recognized by T-cells 3 n=1 Tax=Chelonus insularis TaxID=460826 RepID=UPI00158E8CB6|nr:squamous cell carcinoma antigen recognized by T-cells 3-like [Chelonus insularis]